MLTAIRRLAPVVAAAAVSTSSSGNVFAAAAQPAGSAAQVAEALYAQGKTKETYEYLTSALAATRTTTDAAERANVLWRLARSEHDLALVEKDAKAKEQLVTAAYKHAAEALALDGANFACHKWAGITLSDLGDFAGTTKKIENAFKIREHFARASELNPLDATSHHLLGVWCFTFADMGWAMRQAASLIFAAPPTCTYEKALEHFSKAEETEPSFYKKNLVMIATCHHRLGKLDHAKSFLAKAIAMPTLNPDDKAAHDEALKLASLVGIKL